ncbi:MAG: SH3 beta-barrel fold-containing protein, partial [Candidatus Woesearchaeota archaeon]
MFTRCVLKQTLLENVCNIEFKKINGDIRKIKCTLKPDLVKHNEKENKRKKIENLDVIAVFDLDKQDWRAFRIENIISIKEIK